jgi:hypothetical protein
MFTVPVLRACSVADSVLVLETWWEQENKKPGVGGGELMVVAEIDR